MEKIKDLYRTKKERKELVYEIIIGDNLSITEIVEIKEQAMLDTIEQKNTLLSGLALRASAVFSDKELTEQVKPLLAKDIIESGVVRGTPFEKKLKEIIT